MKKNAFHVFVLVALALLTACSSASAAATSQGSGRSGSFNGAADATLPEAAQLAVGIFKLDGTPNAVDHEQAVALLTLWKALRMEANSKTPVAQEISAVTRQIQSTLKPEQMQAITGMKLTYQDLGSLMRAKGLGSGGGFGNQTPGLQATRQAGGGGGGFPGGGGGFPGGGFPGGGGGQRPQTTTSAARLSSSGGVGVNVVLINAVIDYLKAK
jgi:hypothetical protein